MSYQFKESFPIVNLETGEYDTVSIYVESKTEEHANLTVNINNYLYLNESEKRLVPNGNGEMSFRMLDEPFHQYRRSIQ